jgi:hypothetical protein
MQRRKADDENKCPNSEAHLPDVIQLPNPRNEVESSNPEPQVSDVIDLPNGDHDRESPNPEPPFPIPEPKLPIHEPPSRPPFQVADPNNVAPIGLNDPAVTRACHRLGFSTVDITYLIDADFAQHSSSTEIQILLHYRVCREVDDRIPKVKAAIFDGNDEIFLEEEEKEEEEAEPLSVKLKQKAHPKQPKSRLQNQVVGHCFEWNAAAFRQQQEEEQNRIAEGLTGPMSPNRAGRYQIAAPKKSDTRKIWP